MSYHSKHGSPFQPDHSKLFSDHNSSPPLTLILSHFFAILFCYVVGVFGLSMFFIVPVLVLFWNHWKECYDTFVWITRLRIEYMEIKKATHKHGESVNWLNEIVERWWTACDGTITKFVQDWMEPIACKFKLEHVVEYLKILSFNTGPYRSKFSNVCILQKVSKPKSSKDDVNVFIPITLENLLHPPIVSTTEGRCTYAIEVDAELNVPSAEFKMQAKLGGIKQKLLMNIESFCLTGTARCVINVDRRAAFPHVSTADFCFLPTPKLKVNCRTLKDKVDISATPILKQIGEKYIEREFQNILVYPKKEHVDFTPTPPAGGEWTSLRDNGLSQGVLTVRIEPVQSGTDTVKKSVSGAHYIKLSLGSQKCRSHLHSNEWSSTFSFLVHDVRSDKLKAKLESKRKMRQSNAPSKLEISLLSLGIGGVDGKEDQGSIDKKVQMSVGSVHLLFSLRYTALPPISLTYPIPSLNNCSMEDSGVLYIHVHGCQGIAPYTAKTSYQPYCVVTQGPDTILRTHSLASSSSSSSVSTNSVAWEKGVEILIRSCRGLELTFEVISDGGTLGSHDSLGWTSLRLTMGQSQIIQHRLSLTCPLRKFAIPHPSSLPPSIYVSVVYRNVESVNLTRDSLQEAFLQRTRQESIASCLDSTTKFLNPHNRGYEVTNAQASSEDEDSEPETSYTSSNTNSSISSRGRFTSGAAERSHVIIPDNDYTNRLMSGLEDSLRINTQIST